MTEFTWLLIATLLAITGMTWFAAAMPVHWKQIFQVQQPQTRTLKLMGLVALFLSLLASLQADHPSMAVLVWVMLLAGSSLFIAMALSYRPHWVRVLCPYFLYLNFKRFRYKFYILFYSTTAGKSND